MAEDSVDEVCEFLDKRGLDQDVVAKFRSEKMDVEAVSHSTDDVLEDLGLTKTGDRVSLRAFCQTIPVTEKAGESKDGIRGIFQ
ncbi:hypothetical protein OS493_038467 [Desmophyllum pertusum]|uniref:SAM domain-containing protein n=1 Tax=Desmophyllum pertusum TaxID=174260 RepID=A0A9W9ZWN6_9CNID|nr:hypothetical protein OS493_038467 [Desmophyllum pertusum]